MDIYNHDFHHFSGLVVEIIRLRDEVNPIITAFALQGFPHAAFQTFTPSLVYWRAHLEVLIIIRFAGFLFIGLPMLYRIVMSTCRRRRPQGRRNLNRPTYHELGTAPLGGLSWYLRDKGHLHVSWPFTPLWHVCHFEKPSSCTNFRIAISAASRSAVLKVGPVSQGWFSRSIKFESGQGLESYI